MDQVRFFDKFYEEHEDSQRIPHEEYINPNYQKNSIDLNISQSQFGNNLYNTISPQEVNPQQVQEQEQDELAQEPKQQISATKSRIIVEPIEESNYLYSPKFNFRIPNLTSPLNTTARSISFQVKVDQMAQTATLRDDIEKYQPLKSPKFPERTNSSSNNWFDSQNCLVRNEALLYHIKDLQTQILDEQSKLSRDLTSRWEIKDGNHIDANDDNDADERPQKKIKVQQSENSTHVKKENLMVSEAGQLIIPNLPFQSKYAIANKYIHLKEIIPIKITNVDEPQGILSDNLKDQNLAYLLNKFSSQIFMGLKEHLLHIASSQTPFPEELLQSLVKWEELFLLKQNGSGSKYPEFYANFAAVQLFKINCRDQLKLIMKKSTDFVKQYSEINALFQDYNHSVLPFLSRINELQSNKMAPYQNNVRVRDVFKMNCLYPGNNGFEETIKLCKDKTWVKIGNRTDKTLRNMINTEFDIAHQVLRHFLNDPLKLKLPIKESIIENKKK